jgi:hypothetical protein
MPDNRILAGRKGHEGCIRRPCMMTVDSHFLQNLQRIEDPACPLQLVNISNNKHKTNSNVPLLPSHSMWSSAKAVLPLKQSRVQVISPLLTLPRTEKGVIFIVQPQMGTFKCCTESPNILSTHRTFEVQTPSNALEALEH